MSYILDALKKADAQRERDPARGIHAQPAPPSGGAGPSRDGRRRGFWAAAAVGLAVLASAGWYLYQDQEAVARAAVPRVTTGAPSVAFAAAPVTPVVPLPVPVATAVLPPPPPVVAVTEPARDPRSTSQPKLRGHPQVAQAAPAPGVPDASPGAVVQSGSTAPTAPMAPAAGAAAATPAAAPFPPVPAPATAVPATPIAPFPPRAAVIAPPPPPPPPRAPVIVPTPPAVGLPADAPKLVITGGVYSSNPGQRLLIVNGQVFNQGAELGSGVTLEEIKPKSAVLTFRSVRYSVAY